MQMRRTGHGTYADYQTHKRRSEVPCEPCRAANAAYTRGIRLTNEQVVLRERVARGARRRALTRLAREYRARYLVLFDEELANGNADE